ncbi:MAG: DnaB-like helicase C-terminal domain-containing protein [Oscillospiraceae bacterium]
MQKSLPGKHPQAPLTENISLANSKIGAYLLIFKRDVVILLTRNRDDFSEQTKMLLSNRAGARCSNPACQRPTFGSNSDPNKATNIGVAAHICAAAPGGPRYDATMTSEERKSPQNGIWLCQSCSKLIDTDTTRYSKETLVAWKMIANGNADIIILDDLDGLDIGDTSSLNSFLYKLRGAANQSGTIVVLLVDLEENPKRMDKRPMLTDPKINKLATFCDVVQFLYHDSYNDYHASSDTKILEAIIAKNYSDGKVGTVELIQLLPYSAIENNERREEKKKDAFEKYPGLIAGAKTLIDCLEKL